MQNLIRESIIQGCSFTTADYLSYWSVNTFLHERNEEWVQLLHDLIIGDDGNSISSMSSFSTLTNGCLKARMVLGQCCGEYEMFKNFHAQAQQDASRRQVLERHRGPPTTTKAKDDNRCCLVCFDEVPDEEACQLLPCGHLTCLSCSEAYLKSAANSGMGGIQCASHKCNVSIGIYDAVHILFKEGNADEGDTLAETHATFQRLVRFALERSIPHGARFCPSPNCGRTLAKTASSLVPDTPGFNTLMCACGTSLCAECEISGPAHPGVSCFAFSKIRATMESGKIDNELEK
jgi:hypothetical protein